MQLMPRTVAEMEEIDVLLGAKGDALFNPKINIELGKYLYI